MTGQDQLEVLLHHDPHAPTSPDLDEIRRRGRHRRRGARAAGLVGVLVLVLVAGGVWVGVGRDTGVRAVPASSTGHRVTGLTAYERRVLAQVPSSYQVDGTVVLPLTAHAGPMLRQQGATRTTGTPVPLGFDGRAGPGYLPTTHTQKPYLDNAPKGSQVVVDPGPVWLGCESRAGLACAPAVLGTADDGQRYRLYGIGSDSFLHPGAPMELFIDDDYSAHTWHASLIGGLHGTSITRVVVDLVDGTSVEATVNAGRLSAGNTLFWARLAAMPRHVTAYDAGGHVVAEHTVKACSGGVDCEVR